MEAVVEAVGDRFSFVKARPATSEQIGRAHSSRHMKSVSSAGLYEIAALAAGGAVQAALIGMKEPAFALIRPPGHHASRDHSWGFCYFNNMAIALLELRAQRLIRSALVLDIDLHFGDGTVDILGGQGWVRIHNPSSRDRELYLKEVEEAIAGEPVDMIGVSAGFDYHQDDWGGLLTTEDYGQIARWVRKAASQWGSGCFAVLEGGYNHQVLGENVVAFLEGLS
jgi:acetoin utilization deacetylase AcuC-like enzyme